jgi:hypothetical protein
MTASPSAVPADPVAIAVRGIHAMADGDRADVDSMYDRRGRRPREPGPAAIVAGSGARRRPQTS